MPVNDLMENPPRAHLRQGAPERSSARRPAFMAPWLALGPSLWAVEGWRDLEDGESAVPSSLGVVSNGSFDFLVIGVVGIG